MLSSDAEDDVTFPSLTGSDITILDGGEVEMGFDSEEEMEAESGCDSEDGKLFKILESAKATLK